MPVCACRVCGSAFFEKPLLHYENMPKSAQNFPDAAALADIIAFSLNYGVLIS